MPGKEAGVLAAFLAPPSTAAGGALWPSSEEVAVLASVFLSEQI